MQHTLWLFVATAVFLMAGCLARPTAPESPRLPPEKVLAQAAMETVVQFNRSELAALSPEIPPEFWTAEIAALQPLQVYQHNNNLAILLPRPDGDPEAIDGIYVHTPISSYYPTGDRIELTLGQESYVLTVVN